MDKKRIFLPLSLILSGISAMLSIVPIVLIWYIASSLLSNPTVIDIVNIRLYAWLAFGCGVGAVIIYFIALVFSHITAFRVEVGLQKIAMDKILNKPLGFFDKHSSGKIRKIVNNGAATTHSYIAHQLPDMAASFVTPVILIVLIFVVDWKMGLTSLIPLALAIITMIRLMSVIVGDFQKSYNDALEEISSESVEYVRGIPVVKTFGQSIFSFKRFHNSIVSYKEMIMKYTRIWRRGASFYKVITMTAAFFLIPLAIFLIGRGDNLALVLADFIFYVIISSVFAVYLTRSMNFTQYTMVAEEAINRIDNLLDYQDMPLKEETKTSKIHSLEFKDVVFTYDGGLLPAVNRISFQINEGESVALVGPSGGGKTTIARLAARFWDVDEGEILLGGINIKDFQKDELMNKISFAFQSTKLFKGSIRDNILIGMEDASEEEINEAIDYSQSREIIDGLPDGLDTIIGTKGTFLSGGEQQRIALARAIVKNAPIVLLDEATAFADPENEHLIQRALKELSRGKTSLMIAHRLTTVQNVDRILVINEGKVIEMGSHTELIAKGGTYKKMWDEYQKSVTWKISTKNIEHGGEQYV
jgi:ATP-binding cassette subfamily B protein